MSYQINFNDDSQFRPMDIWQLIIFYCFYGTAVQFPIYCTQCGVKTKGNRVTGYKMGCKHG